MFHKLFITNEKIMYQLNDFYQDDKLKQVFYKLFLFTIH